MLDLVESHYERLDAGGDPNRVPAGDLEVRILRHRRLRRAHRRPRIREAWPAERALALLDDETGRAFDPECVAALRSIVASERPALSPAPAHRELDPAFPPAGRARCSAKRPRSAASR